MCHHRWDPPLLLPGLLLLDVSRGGSAVPDARGGLWERILTEKVLLRVRLPLPCHCGRRLHSYRLQELWDRESVSAAFLANPHTQRAECCTTRAHLLCVYMWQGWAFQERSTIRSSSGVIWWIYKILAPYSRHRQIWINSLPKWESGWHTITHSWALTTAKEKKKTETHTKQWEDILYIFRPTNDWAKSSNYSDF